ncbi:hypothetical protein BCS42_12545 [Crenothrix sp. D3]|nr:hypothetical protein BCS42_12545 [Crenothrix sp. D3]
MKINVLILVLLVVPCVSWADDNSDFGAKPLQEYDNQQNKLILLQQFYDTARSKALDFKMQVDKLTEENRKLTEENEKLKTQLKEKEGGGN